MLHSPLNQYSFRSRRSRRGDGKPEHRRNIPSAFFSLVAAGLYAVAMAEPNWLKIENGRCAGQHVGLYKVFGSVGKSTANLKALYCMSDSAVVKLRLVASFCLVAVFACLVQFGLDTCGTQKRGLSCLRRNSVFTILTVLLTVVTMTLVYWVSRDIRDSDLNTMVSVHLSAAFYLLIGAGAVTLLATTLNLMHCTCERRGQSPRDGMELELIYDELPLADALPPVPPPMYQP